MTVVLESSDFPLAEQLVRNVSSLQSAFHLGVLASLLESIMSLRVAKW